jgi:hypothetical protein
MVPRASPGWSLFFHARPYTHRLVRTFKDNYILRFQSNVDQLLIDSQEQHKNSNYYSP